MIFDSGKDNTIWQRISMDAVLSNAAEAEIGFRVCAASTYQSAFNKWWSCALSFNFPDEVSADLTWDNVVGRWLFLDVWMVKGQKISWIKAEYDKPEQSIALKPICDTENKKLTILPLGDDAHYVIKGVVFDEVLETFPWEHTFTSYGIYYVVLGGDKKFHIFENGYDAENYLPIVKVDFESSVPIMWVVYNIFSQLTIAVTATEGNSPGDVTFTVLNAGDGEMGYSVNVDSAWLTCSPTSGIQEGTPADTITVSFATDYIPVGTYTALIHIETGQLNVLNAPTSIEVQLTIT